MLTKLTKKQEVLLAEINKEVVDKFYNWGKSDEKQIEDSVEKLYFYAKLKKPKVVFLDFNDRSAVRSAVDSAVDSAVGSAVGSAVDSAVRSAVRSAVGSAVGSAVDSAVRSAVRSAVDSAVRSAVDSAVRSAVDSAIRYGWYQWYREEWWTRAYATFFSKILPNFPIDLFNEYRKIYDAGFMYLFMFEKVCFVVKMPEKIEWSGEGYARRLHSDAKEALDVSGLKLYFLNGVQFEETLWRKVVSGKMPFNEILAIVDIDQRTQAMKYGNVHEFLKYSKAIQLDTHEKETLEGIKIKYSLHKIPETKDLFRETAYYVVYDCPSTGKLYMSGVEECKSVEAAFAWKFQCTQKDWMNMIPLVHES